MQHVNLAGAPLAVRAEGRMAGPSPDLEAAEAAFRASIEAAKDQSAIAWELKGALPLARMLVQRGRESDALALVGSIHGAHEEKSGTADLEEAAQFLSHGKGGREAGSSG